jgi:hypothetical protein
LEITEDALDYAYQRVEAFARVNLSRSRLEKGESIPRIWDVVGMTPGALEALHSIMDELVPDRDQGGFLLGVLYALFIREYEDA